MKKLISIDDETGVLPTVVVNAINALIGIAATPTTGTKVTWVFKFTDPAVARPSVPSYVCLNWVGPSGTGNTAPTNMAVDDIWDMTA